jgi:hypothetical protein
MSKPYKSTSTADNISQLFDNSRSNQMMDGQFTANMSNNSVKHPSKTLRTDRLSRSHNRITEGLKSTLSSFSPGCDPSHNVHLSGSLGRLEKHNKPTKAVTVPLTLEQSDLGMESSLLGIIPMSDSVGKEDLSVFLAQTGNLCLANLQKPPFKVVQLPSYIIEAGPQCDQKLLTPLQRREYMTFEKKKLDANLAIKRSKALRMKTRDNISSGKSFRENSISDSGDTNTYGFTVAENHEINRTLRLYSDRKNYLAQKSSATSINGDFILPNTIPQSVPLTTDIRRKGGSNNLSSFDDTFKRLFVAKENKSSSSERAQGIRDRDLYGKEYNHISHSEIEHWPSRKIERIAYAHPQGSVQCNVASLLANIRSNYY